MEISSMMCHACMREVGYRRFAVIVTSRHVFAFGGSTRFNRGPEFLAVHYLFMRRAGT